MDYKYYINKSGHDISDYLAQARKRAKTYGLTPANLNISKNPKYKLQYETDSKIIHFGSAINKDFIIYKMLAKSGLIPNDKPKKKRHAYLSRATNIKGNWKNNKLSKNNLAIHILW